MRVIAGLIGVCECGGEVQISRNPVRVRVGGRVATVCGRDRDSDVVGPALRVARRVVREDDMVSGFKAGFREFLERMAAKAVVTVEERWGASPHWTVEELLPSVDDVLWRARRVSPVPMPDTKDPVRLVRSVGRTG